MARQDRGTTSPDRGAARARLGDGAASALLDLLGDEVLAQCESEGERVLGPLLSRFSPPPEPQVQVLRGRRVDWFFRRLRLALEYLGSVDHDTLLGRMADDARDRELQDAGIRVRYVRAADLADDAALISSLAGTLALRANELGVDAPTLRA